MPDRHAMVLDTSAVLNLMGSGNAARVVEALGAICYVPPQVIAEVVREPPYPGPCPSLQDLIQQGVFRPLAPAGDFLDTFIALASALPPDGLGDGEAATIAGAEMLNCVAVLDENKGKRIALSRCPERVVQCTVELYQSLIESRAIPPDELAKSVFNSLQHARMRVPQSHGSWVLDLIGDNSARECPSLSAILRTARR